MISKIQWKENTKERTERMKAFMCMLRKDAGLTKSQLSDAYRSVAFLKLSPDAQGLVKRIETANNSIINNDCTPDWLTYGSSK